jgi:hypothetical protein
MFTYINENFLHAPSSDLSRETVKTLISVTLAQAQEVFLEKQINDNKKVAMLAKLASQAAYLYSQALEGVQENVNKAIFEKVWLLFVQVCYHHASVAVNCERFAPYTVFLFFSSPFFLGSCAGENVKLTMDADQIQLISFSIAVLPSYC